MPHIANISKMLACQMSLCEFEPFWHAAYYQLYQNVSMEIILRSNVQCLTVQYLKNLGPQDGIAGDIVPLAASNVFKKNITTIFYSGMRQYMNITPIQCQPCGNWYYGYILMEGFEHYLQPMHTYCNRQNNSTAQYVSSYVAQSVSSPAGQYLSCSVCVQPCCTVFILLSLCLVLLHSIYLALSVSSPATQYLSC